VGEKGDESGIPDAAILLEFAEAAIGADPARLDAARAAVIEAMGGAALSDAAAVAALFNAIDRVADATGIPLEDDKAAMTTEMRAHLGIDAMGTIPEAADA